MTYKLDSEEEGLFLEVGKHRVHDYAVCLKVGEKFRYVEWSLKDKSFPIRTTNERYTMLSPKEFT